VARAPPPPPMGNLQSLSCTSRDSCAPGLSADNSLPKQPRTHNLPPVELVDGEVLDVPQDPVGFVDVFTACRDSKDDRACAALLHPEIEVQTPFNTVQGKESVVLEFAKPVPPFTVHQATTLDPDNPMAAYRIIKIVKIPFCFTFKQQYECAKDGKGLLKLRRMSMIKIHGEVLPSQPAEGGSYTSLLCAGSR